LPEQPFPATLRFVVRDQIFYHFVLLLGVPGVIGYLLHRRWPVFETCSACGRVVGDREACHACGDALPPPPPTGTEVFA
jgi:hypothetical protein